MTTGRADAWSGSAWLVDNHVAHEGRIHEGCEARKKGIGERRFHAVDDSRRVSEHNERIIRGSWNRNPVEVPYAEVHSTNPEHRA